MESESNILHQLTSFLTFPLQIWALGNLQANILAKVHYKKLLSVLAAERERRFIPLVRFYTFRLLHRKKKLLSANLSSLELHHTAFLTIMSMFLCGKS